jgi:WD40 repeat protein
MALCWLVAILRGMSSPVAGTQTAREMRPYRTFEGHTGWVEGIRHLPGVQQIMTCSEDGSLRVWDLESGKRIGEYWRDKESGAHIEALSPNRKKVVSKSLDGAVRLWDIDTSEIIAEWAGHTGVVLSMCWSRDGRRVVSRSNDGTARVWDLENEETILESIRSWQDNQ